MVTLAAQCAETILAHAEMGNTLQSLAQCVEMLHAHVLRSLAQCVGMLHAHALRSLAQCVGIFHARVMVETEKQSLSSYPTSVS